MSEARSTHREGSHDVRSFHSTNISFIVVPVTGSACAEVQRNKMKINTIFCCCVQQLFCARHETEGFIRIPRTTLSGQYYNNLGFVDGETEVRKD